ncbi:RNA polymerase sigma factor [Brevibacillus laterosporus]|uniref:Sigma-70 family RNA polymerase sigma factor n=2 Tax=Brevibacillus laterosporus TaxID=1465 RepID=A0AAP3GBE2_BRELA|nr:sigma-70 family RNA polymerase sigma factor [Brevibacillus laterosporus]MCR8980762.1 sigma-70 family RNA polymerase sigma factor [Brevibacillus laterosporus]MCZ0807917.1 sigma-70 family RNA polymerase sigma factor [Brevibacillus laterosporus]MCZ0826192.1 sigma-70 family RNA polymerase sigma factor [Brevibacillus laterosporus]MCZ0851203.1 sigma-70 family RNA polymerase sigma factor [Brevibacillus laterosporus]
MDQFEQTLKIYQKPIFLYCYHMLSNHTEAEDAGQEVFLKAFRHLNKYNTEIPFRAWLYKIAYHQCIDMLRKKKLARYLPFFYKDETQNNHIDDQIEATYFNESISLSMSKLTAEERNLLILRCIEEKSYEEISLILNRKSASLRKKYERAATKFRKSYAQVKEGEMDELAQERSGFKKTIY